MRVKISLILFFLLFSIFSCRQSESPQAIETDILVVGGGASGVPAALQAARMGVNVVLIEQTDWLGGMLTAAGVSATDGNHNLPSGIWGEFRNRLSVHYGGDEALATGWVSNTQFEPSVGNRIFKDMVAEEPGIQLYHGYVIREVFVEDGAVTGARFQNAEGVELRVNAAVTIEATEYGDVLALSNTPYYIGMDPRSRTGEVLAPEQGNDMIQDLTYVAILKDYGDADVTIPEPEGYEPTEFNCSCRDYCDDEELAPTLVTAETMLEYGKLPNGKYMINWPNFGNDAYVNSLEEEPGTRTFEGAKQHTLRFVYFIQHELGFSHLGLADDEFPTDDQLAIIPYHRESRRLDGKQMVTVEHLQDPYGLEQPLYPFGVAVGDYPLDHHRDKNPEPVEIDFPPIPSFSIPYGALVPREMKGLLVAEKSISTSSLANGSTRLQPCVMGIGQAAGAAAALSVQQGITPSEIDVRQLQEELLHAGCWIQPYIDVKPEHWYFSVMQKAGLNGFIRGHGVPYKWANQTWIYPDSTVSRETFIHMLNLAGMELENTGEPELTIRQALEITNLDAEVVLPEFYTEKQLETPLTRKEAAAILGKVGRVYTTPLFLQP